MYQVCYYYVTRRSCCASPAGCCYMGDEPSIFLSAGSIAAALVVFIKSWKTSAVSNTTVWMVETQLCKLRGTSDTLTRSYNMVLWSCYITPHHTHHTPCMCTRTTDNPYWWCTMVAPTRRPFYISGEFKSWRDRSRAWPILLALLIA